MFGRSARSVLVLIIWILPAFASFATTTLSSSINQNTTLTLAGSPYLATGDVTVGASATLTVEAGVEIRFRRNAGLYVYGRVKMLGSQSANITLKPDTGLSEWEVVSLINTTSNSEFRYVRITGTTKGNNTDRDRAAISANDFHSVTIDHVDIRNAMSCLYLRGGSNPNSITNCHFESYDNGSQTAMVRCEVLIDACEFIGNNTYNSDCIDFDKVNATITNNIIHGMTGSESDAIDMGSESVVTVNSNIIYNIRDSGIEAEESSVITASRNVVYNCGIGATIKQLATGTLINNTFYDVDTCFTAYSEEGIVNQGGNITAKNNIVASVKRVYSSRHNSVVTLSYNLRDEGSITGTGSFTADPRFVNASGKNFNLLEDSPAIDAGDPNSPADEDGTRADIGAFSYFQEIQRNLILTEIGFKPLTNTYENPDREFLEFYNKGTTTIDLTGYHFTAGIEFTFPNGAQVGPGQYLILTRDGSYFPGVTQKYEWSSGSLSNSGEKIEIQNDDNKTIVSVTYSLAAPWPKPPLDIDVTLMLKSVDLDPTVGTSWRISYTSGGSPGKSNSRQFINNLFINELVSNFGTLNPDEHGLYSDWIEIYNGSDLDIDLGGLFLSDRFDDLGHFKVPEGHADSTYIRSKGFYVFRADLMSKLGVNHIDIQLASAGEQFCISQATSDSYRMIDSLSFGHLGQDISYGRYPDGSSTKRTFDTPTPGSPNVANQVDLRNVLFINEVLARFGTRFPDEHGLYSDWIEIYNSGNVPVSLAGLYLSDKPNNPEFFRISPAFPDSLTIPAKGFYVFRADARPELGVNHVDFELASSGEYVLLSQKIGNQTVRIDSMAYGVLPVDVSFGRMSDGNPSWIQFPQPTPGASNSGNGVEEDIRLSEGLEINVYPNPAFDFVSIRIESDRPRDCEIQLSNLQGQKIEIPLFTNWISAGSTTFTIQAGQFNPRISPGVYNLIIRSGKSAISRKIIFLGSH